MENATKNFAYNCLAIKTSVLLYLWPSHKSLTNSWQHANENEKRNLFYIEMMTMSFFLNRPEQLRKHYNVQLLEIKLHNHHNILILQPSTLFLMIAENGLNGT